MSEHYVPKLGEIIAPDDNQAARDCVHVALAPVVAGERLYPGWHVGRREDGAFARDAAPIGIVDPFIPEDKTPVEPGERFWLLLYQNSITNLRHQWSHPAFAPKPPARRVEE